jgi:2-polyprenyl-3-methyl-5-hydroxy-6-metoxy-1,4-benzoquinol methylase
MGTPDSREYERLVKRGFKPYSYGHRRMYEIAIDRMKPGARVFEVGFGIGWGAERILDSGKSIVYEGCEPNKDSFNYTEGRIRHVAGVNNAGLHNKPFFAGLAANAPYDYAFCIEVIEHVPMEDHVGFLRDLKALAPVVFFSTPDIVKAPTEGVRTKDEWVSILREAGFTSIEVITRHWTYLYVCS